MPPEIKTARRKEAGESIGLEEDLLCKRIEALLRQKKDDRERPSDAATHNANNPDTLAWLARQEEADTKIAQLRGELCKVQAGKLPEQLAVATRGDRKLAHKPTKSTKATHRAARLTLATHDQPGALPHYMDIDGDGVADDYDIHTPLHKIGLQILRVLESGRKVFSNVIEDVSSIFSAIDRDGGGDIDTHEFHDGLQRLGVYLDELQQQELFEGIDTDKNGLIDKEEFITFLTQCKGNSGDDAIEQREYELCDEIAALQEARLKAMSEGDETKLDRLEDKLEVLRAELDRLVKYTQPSVEKHLSYEQRRVKKHKQKTLQLEPFNLDTRVPRTYRPGKRFDETVRERQKNDVPLANPRRSVWAVSKDKMEDEILLNHSSQAGLNRAYTPGRPPYKIIHVAVNQDGVVRGKGHVYHGSVPNIKGSKSSHSTAHGITV